MLTLAAIKENPQEIIKRLAVKHFDGEGPINEILQLDKERRAAQTKFDQNGSELKKMAAQIGALMKEGKKDEAEKVKASVAQLKDANKKIEDELEAAAGKITDILLSVPNTPCPAVPEGTSSADNVVEKEGGKMPDLPADALPHWELAKKYNLIDFELGVKITGAGFPVYLGKGAKLQRALIQFFLDEATKAGYLETQPPYVVNEASGIGTGQLPDKEDQPHPDGRSAGDQPLPRRDFRREGSSPQKLRLLCLLPPRSRVLRKGCSRTEPPTPVRQGGNRTYREAGKLLRSFGGHESPCAKPC